MRVVVVDDAATLRSLITQALHQGGGFRVVGEAADGMEAIDVVAHHRPDLVLLDLAMPVMDGLEALPWIRRAAPDAAVVVFTGFGDPSLAQRALAAGAVGVLEKGLDAARLCRDLHRLVAERGRGPEVRAVPPPPTHGSSIPRATPARWPLTPPPRPDTDSS